MYIQLIVMNIKMYSVYGGQVSLDFNKFSKS